VFVVAARRVSNPALHAVKDGDPAVPVEPVKAKPMTLAEAVESGDYLEILRAQRREIVEALPTVAGPAKAAMHRQLSIVSKEIQQLELKAKAEQEAPNADEDENGPSWDADAI
jgi:hypothetical protein